MPPLLSLLPLSGKAPFLSFKAEKPGPEEMQAGFCFLVFRIPSAGIGTGDEPVSLAMSFSH